jgi:hypothetical protein
MSQFARGKDRVLADVEADVVKPSKKSWLARTKEEVLIGLQFYFISKRGNMNLAHLSVELVDGISTVLLLMLPLLGYASSIRASVSSIAAALLTLVPCVQSDAKFLQRKAGVASSTLVPADFAVFARLVIARTMCFVFVFTDGPWIPITFILYGLYDFMLMCFLFVRQVMFMRRSPMRASWITMLFFSFMSIFSILLPFGFAFTLSTVQDPIVAAALTIACKASASGTTRLLMCNIRHLARRLWLRYLPGYVLLVGVVTTITTKDPSLALTMAIAAFALTKIDWLFNLADLARSQEDVVFSAFLRINRWYHVLWTLHDYCPRPKQPSEGLSAPLIAQ